MELGLGGCCGNSARSVFMRRVRFLVELSYFLLASFSSFYLVIG